MALPLHRVSATYSPDLNGFPGSLVLRRCLAPMAAWREQRFLNRIESAPNSRLQGPRRLCARSKSAGKN